MTLHEAIRQLEEIEAALRATYPNAFASPRGAYCSVEGTCPHCTELLSRPKCGKQVAREDSFEDQGEGEETGRTFNYCSEYCRETH